MSKIENETFQLLKEVFTDLGWKPNIYENEMVCKLHCNLSSLSVELNAVISADIAQFFILIDSSINIPNNKKTIASEYLLRVNYELGAITFDMDFDTGDVRCKAAIDFKNGSISKMLMQNTILTGLKTADIYFPGLHKVILGNFDSSGIKEIIRNQEQTIHNKK
ncbi:hypothetical protein GCM10009430_32080 [Aquimarina litoralis]|uniref:SCP2 domain-containing protein n=1 Tax=Aquimarina litoralis TaxID=584605 RepID=A0ABN1J1F1_9FLAO